MTDRILLSLFCVAILHIVPVLIQQDIAARHLNFHCPSNRSWPCYKKSWVIKFSIKNVSRERRKKSLAILNIPLTLIRFQGRMSISPLLRPWSCLFSTWMKMEKSLISLKKLAASAYPLDLFYWLNWMKYIRGEWVVCKNSFDEWKAR